MQKVLLQDRQTRRYYAGPDHWVEDPAQALSFSDVSEAAKAFTEEDLTDAEILIQDGSLADPSARSASRSTSQAHHGKQL